MYQKLDENSGTENVGFKVLHTKLDSPEVSPPDVCRARQPAEQDGTIKLPNFKWIYICKVRLLTVMA